MIAACRARATPTRRRPAARRHRNRHPRRPSARPSARATASAREPRAVCRVSRAARSPSRSSRSISRANRPGPGLPRRGGLPVRADHARARGLVRLRARRPPAQLRPRTTVPASQVRRHRHRPIGPASVSPAVVGADRKAASSLSPLFVPIKVDCVTWSGMRNALPCVILLKSALFSLSLSND